MSEEAVATSGEACLLTTGPGGKDCRVRRAIRNVLCYGLVFLYGFCAMYYFASEPKTFSDGTSGIGVAGNDSFYHLKMASMLPEYGLVDTFPWLQFSYFRSEGDAFVSHHYGFHCLLLPFVEASEWLTGDALAAGRWAVSTFFGLSTLLFFAILRARRVPWPWAWLLLWMLLPSQFYMRHAYVRAIGPSLVCMLLLVLLVIKRRPILVGIVAALANHIYLGSVMFTPVIIGAFAAACVLGKGGFRNFPWRIVVAAVIGWAVGIVTYPYLSGMYEFLRMQVFGTGLTPRTDVGREWKPYVDVWTFLPTMASALLVTFGVSAIARVAMGPRLRADEKLLLLLNIGFFLLTLKARRFIEYWPVFALLSAALLAEPVIRRLWVTPAVEEEAGESEGPNLGDRLWALAMFGSALFVIAVGIFNAWSHAREWGLGDAGWLGASGVALFVLVIFFGAERDRVIVGSRSEGFAARVLIALAGIAFITQTGHAMWRNVRDESKLRFDLPEVRKMMAFLKADSNAGDVIFTTDWDDFPLFFYHNNYDYYVVGLDPEFTHGRRPLLWERYVKITRGQAPAEVSADRYDKNGRLFTDRAEVRVSDIRDQFRADYVITDRDHKPLARQLSRDESLAKLVYPCTKYADCRKAPYLVFRVLPVRGTASQPTTDAAN